VGSGIVYEDGMVGRAFSFDGTSASVQVEGSESLDISEAITMATWIYPRSTEHGGILRKGAPETHGSCALALFEDKVYLQLNSAAVNLASTADIPANA
jgi:hypothetical protein